MARRRVVLPAPEGPKRVSNRPGFNFPLGRQGELSNAVLNPALGQLRRGMERIGLGHGAACQRLRVMIARARRTTRARASNISDRAMAVSRLVSMAAIIARGMV